VGFVMLGVLVICILYSEIYFTLTEVFLNLTEGLLTLTEVFSMPFPQL
jgi:hypothetical protein